MSTLPRLPGPGEPVPWFTARCGENSQFQFHTAAGRYIILCFFGRARALITQAVLNDFYNRRDIFDDQYASFFGVSIDPLDEQLSLVRESLPGVRCFWDFDQTVSRLYGACGSDTSDAGGETSYRQFTFVVDERLRVVACFPFDDPGHHAERVLQCLSTLPRSASPSIAPNHAPVLIVPRVFEPALCDILIKHYLDHGGRDSGVMREVNNQTVEIHDHNHKRRLDCNLVDEKLRNACMHRIHDRLVPEIQKVFQYRATRIERYLVACYEAETAGRFRPHRDNTTRGTAHRRFAVSVNLNTGDFEGGQVRFPEYGGHLYCPPRGGALVFSCSLLHEAMPVTCGRRYVFLPFLYDDEAAKIRDQNRQFIHSPAE